MFLVSRFNYVSLAIYTLHYNLNILLLKIQIKKICKNCIQNPILGSYSILSVK